MPLFFAGARADFDTEAGCPNVWNHSARVRSALLALSPHVPGAELRALQVCATPCAEAVSQSKGGSKGESDGESVTCPLHACYMSVTHPSHARYTRVPMEGREWWRDPTARAPLWQHNMRHCNGSSACQSALKRHAAGSMARSRFCPVAGGDTPSTGARGPSDLADVRHHVVATDTSLESPRKHVLPPSTSGVPLKPRAHRDTASPARSPGRLFDAISCGCVPIIISDDLELPFPKTAPLAATSFGVRLLEAQFLTNPASAIQQIVEQPLAAWRALQQQVLRARRRLSYRAPGSLVATLALREAWATCLWRRRSTARPLAEVARC